MVMRMVVMFWYILREVHVTARAVSLSTPNYFNLHKSLYAIQNRYIMGWSVVSWPMNWPLILLLWLFNIREKFLWCSGLISMQWWCWNYRRLWRMWCYGFRMVLSVALVLTLQYLPGWTRNKKTSREKSMLWVLIELHCA